MIASLLVAALQEPQDTRTWTVEFENVTCDDCVGNLRRMLRALPEARDVQVRITDAVHQRGQATILQGEAGRIRIEEVRSAATDYPVRDLRVRLRAWVSRQGDAIVLRARGSDQTIAIQRPRDNEEEALRRYRDFEPLVNGGPQKFDLTVQILLSPAPETRAYVVTGIRQDWPDPRPR